MLKLYEEVFKTFESSRQRFIILAFSFTCVVFVYSLITKTVVVIYLILEPGKYWSLTTFAHSYTFVTKQNLM